MRAGALAVGFLGFEAAEGVADLATSDGTTDSEGTGMPLAALKTAHSAADRLVQHVGNAFKQPSNSAATATPVVVTGADYSNTGASNYVNDGAVAYSDTGNQNYATAGNQVYLNTQTQGYSNTGNQDYLNTGNQDYSNTVTQDYSSTGRIDSFNTGSQDYYSNSGGADYSSVGSGDYSVDTYDTGTTYDDSSYDTTADDLAVADADSYAAAEESLAVGWGEVDMDSAIF